MPGSPLASEADDRALARSRRYRDLEAQRPVGPLQLEGVAPAAVGRFQAQPDLGLDVAAGHAEARRAALAAEEPLEEVAELLLAALPAIRACRLPARRRREVRSRRPARAQLVVARALLGVGQDGVGLVQLLEASVGRLVRGVDVRVVLAGEPPVGLLDLVRAGVAGNPEHLVVVPGLQGHVPPRPPIPRPAPWRGGGARRSTGSRGRPRRPRSPRAASSSRTVAMASWSVGSKGWPTLSNDFTPSASSRLRQPAPHAVEARGHRVRRLVDVNEGAIEAVGQVDECFQQLPLGLPGGHVAIALDPPPVVLEVCPRPQVAVVLLLQLASQFLDRVLPRARRRRRVVSRVFLHVTRPPHFRVNSASTTSCAASAWEGPEVGE